MGFQTAKALLMNASMSEVLCEVSDFKVAGDNLTPSAACEFGVPFSFAMTGGSVGACVVLADSRPFHIHVTRCGLRGSCGYAEGVVVA